MRRVSGERAREGARGRRGWRGWGLWLRGGGRGGGIGRWWWWRRPWCGEGGDEEQWERRVLETSALLSQYIIRSGASLFSFQPLQLFYIH
jgi:hypothetical protein